MAIPNYARERHCPTCNCLDDGMRTDRMTRLLAQGYRPIDPFTEYRTPILHIHLSKAQARVELLEAEVQYLRDLIYRSRLTLNVGIDGDDTLTPEN